MQNGTTVTEFILLQFSQPSPSVLPLWLFLSFATLMGNALAFLFICPDYHLHRAMYFFIYHLSIVDICCASNNVSHMLRNFLGQVTTFFFAGCGTQIHFYLILALTECMLLDVISYDLYVAICHPRCYVLIRNWKVRLTLAAVSWAFEFMFGTLQASLASHLPFCGWHNTFCTCGSHLTVVGLFYGNAIFMYMGPGRSNSSEREKVLSLFYSLVSPTLNPLIYSLINKQVKEFLLKLQRRKRIFHSM